MNKVDQQQYTNNAEMIVELQQQMSLSGDEQRVRKLDQLLKKVNQQQMFIALCGHFSAGKSSMINRLCGTQLLPSSPIPTSANVVSIRNGNPEAVIYRKSNSGQLDHSAVSPEMLEQYCKDGEEIESVEIRFPLPWLGDHAVLLDTPGIDSTDAAHRMATESALHLADVVFYVMDYNHVLSETNFAFTRQLTEWGKPFYLIVNQIDKHNEQELPFEKYKETVRDSFASWLIEPDGILFVSLKQPLHPANDWEALKWLLSRLIAEHNMLTGFNVKRAAAHLLDEHADFNVAKHAADKERLQLIVNEADEGGAGLIKKWDELQSKREFLLQAAERERQQLRKEAAGIIEHAPIMPAVTRDLADTYLQSRKPGFKVGFLSRAAQTAKEKEVREQAFCEQLGQNVRIHLERHVRDFLSKSLERLQVHSERLFEEIAVLTVQITPEWLEDRVQPSAGFTPEYTMTYCKVVAGDIQTAFRRQSFECIDEMISLFSKLTEAQKQQLENEMTHEESRVQAYRELQAIEAKERDERGRLASIVKSGQMDQRPVLPDPGEYYEKFDRVMNDTAETEDVHAFRNPVQSLSNSEQKVENLRDVSRQPAGELPSSSLPSDGLHIRMEQMADKLGQAAELIRAIPAMRSIERAMRDKESKLRRHTFTLSLFGAFSAGKSSFANALMGERILPVSPNPTTAAINRIVAPREGWEHGSAKVVLKTSAQILDDLQYSLKALGFHADHIDAALHMASQLEPDQVIGPAKPHYSFLKAAMEGWKEAQPDLGHKLKVNVEQFAAYVAEERKSCFVDHIELYHSNRLTEQGIVIVDTPGADSINARHTGVAFNYIKNADAILFVTYYNHAFSQADKEFLLQLGRVKDSFELDKMFFIVNAADLASTKEELDGVLQHVESNLLTHDIRFPRIYPVSSRMAIQGKQEGDSSLVALSGISHFEHEFARFCLDELAEMAIRSARHEITRAAAILEDWLESSRQSEQERIRRLTELRQAEEHVLQLISGADSTEEKKQVSAETEELLYYVKQRSGFRFNEFFNYAFNPATIRDNGQLRTSMTTSWNELIRILSVNLSQEVLATTLRIETFMQKLAAEKMMAWHEAIVSQLPSFPQDETVQSDYETPVVSEQIEDVPADSKWLAGFYKNGKQFFEGDGKNRMRTEVEERLIQPVSHYLNDHARRLSDSYSEQVHDHLNQLARKVQDSIKEHVNGLTEALEMKTDMNLVQLTISQMNELAREANE